MKWLGITSPTKLDPVDRLAKVALTTTATKVTRKACAVPTFMTILWEGTTGALGEKASRENYYIKIKVYTEVR